MKFIYKIFSIIFIIFPLIALANSSDLQDQLDEVINQAIAQKRIVGAVVLISQKGKLIYEGAYGLSDRERNILITKDTVFRYASLTKPIVTVAALKLIEQGKMNLNDPIIKWLPEFKPKTADGKIPLITIRHLLTHTAGLTYGFLESKSGHYHKLGISDGLDKVNFSLAENLKRLSAAQLLYTPGSAWSYSLATDVLGAILSKVQNEPLPAVIDQLVLKPLNMHNTGFTAKSTLPLAVPYANHYPQPIRMIDGQKIPYGESFVVFAPSRVFDKNAYPSGGAGMVGTARDYLIFLESIRTKKIGLTEKTLNLLTTNQIGDLKTLLGDGWGWSLGFPILINPSLAKSLQGQGTYQWGGIWGNTWWVDPINQYTVVILTNTALEGVTGQFPADIMNAIYKN